MFTVLQFCPVFGRFLSAEEGGICSLKILFKKLLTLAASFEKLAPHTELNIITAMRTKTLILTAVLSAAGVASSLAQGTVYSVNAVGYVNLTIPTGFSMIANPLNNTAANGNTVSNLFPSVPIGTTIYKFDNVAGTYSINQFSFAGWGSPNDTMLPGDGAFIRNPTASPISVTLVGEVMQGPLS